MKNTVTLRLMGVMLCLGAMGLPQAHADFLSHTLPIHAFQNVSVGQSAPYLLAEMSQFGAPNAKMQREREKYQEHVAKEDQKQDELQRERERERNKDRQAEAEKSIR